MSIFFILISITTTVVKLTDKIIAPKLNFSKLKEVLLFLIKISYK